MKTAIVCSAVAIFFVVFFAFLPFENYNYLWPSVDTHYAPGFSEAKFAKITNGMASSDVLTLLGQPYYTYTNRSAEVVWRYTGDAKCPWGDYAWLVRSVTLTNGCVSEIEKRIAYD